MPFTNVFATYLEPGNAFEELMEENARLQRLAEEKPSVPVSTATLSASDAQTTEQKQEQVPPAKITYNPSTPRSTIAGSPLERRRDLLETLNTIAGLAKALESKLMPQS